jgi:TetR/AcrR family transcriptional regulator, regulator of mycofactocin system
MGVGELTHRERKKQRTREQIVERAMALFDERGFEHVTIAEIAAAADIAPRTFFSYFPSKEDVVFHDFDLVFDAIRERIDERAEGETTMDALRAFVIGLLAEFDHGDPAEQCRRRVISGSPALQQHDRELVGRIEHVIADGLARDLGVEPSSLRARVVAAAAAAGLTELEHFFDKDDPPDDPMAVFDEVFTFVQGGVAALQRRG